MNRTRIFVNLSYYWLAAMRLGFAISSTSASGLDPLANMLLHESRTVLPRGFVMQTAAPPDMKLDLRIALRQRDVDGLERRLYEVSTPGKETYGKYLSKAEVSSYMA
jgi:hypothetical protein